MKVCKAEVTVGGILKAVNFLDISIYLRSDTYQPHMKPNFKPLYIHLKATIHGRYLKKSTERNYKRLITISINGIIFNATTSPYQDACKKSKYNYKLNYNTTSATNTNTERRSLKRPRPTLQPGC